MQGCARSRISREAKHRRRRLPAISLHLIRPRKARKSKSANTKFQKPSWPR
jgi:hypothetical protein